jgi:ParB/RepB/Spo0J family partition protein
MEQQSTIIEWVDPKSLKPHKLSVEIYGEDTYADLVDSIRELGVLQPLYVTPKGIIISGHRRWRAAIEAQKQVPVIRKYYPDALDEKQAIIELNRYRIKSGQQLYNEGKIIKEIEAEKATKRKAQAEGQPRGIKQEVSVVEILPQEKTRDMVARSIGLGSGKQWDKLEYVAEYLPELLPQIKPSGISIDKAYREAKQKQIVKPAQPPEIPEGVFSVIVIDPPWPYYKRQGDITHRGRAPYPTMTIEEIKTKSPPYADNCIVWLWTTNAFMHDAFHILDIWELEPKTILTWVKNKIGVGDWLRGQTEHCILAIKGHPVVNLTNQSTVLHAPAREHSRKPDEFYKLVETLCQGNKLEMYARVKREGWEFHGIETELQ